MGIPHDNGQPQLLIGLVQRVLHLLGLGDVDKGDHRPLDHVIEGAVGLDPQDVPPAIGGLHLHFPGSQGIQHGLDVCHQTVVAHQIGDDMAHRPTDIAGDQVDDTGCGRGKTQDVQAVIDKDGGDAGAGQQIVHVVVGPRQVAHLVLQFGVDRGEFLVDRLQLFLGGLQFLIGGLQFLVDRLHFLVGGFEFLVGGLEIFLLGPELLPQRSDSGTGPGLGRAVGIGRPLFIVPGGGQWCLAGIEGCTFFENDQVKRRRQCGRRVSHSTAAPAGIGTGGQGADGQVGRGEIAVGLDQQPDAAHLLPGSGSLVQGGGQFAAQPFPGHLQDIVDSGLTRGRFQIHAGAAVEIEDIAVAVDQGAGRGDLP